jgi:hypothetical protein
MPGLPALDGRLAPTSLGRTATDLLETPKEGGGGCGGGTENLNPHTTPPLLVPLLLLKYLLSLILPSLSLYVHRTKKLSTKFLVPIAYNLAISSL